MWAWPVEYNAPVAYNSHMANSAFDPKYETLINALCQTLVFEGKLSLRNRELVIDTLNRVEAPLSLSQIDRVIERFLEGHSPASTSVTAREVRRAEGQQERQRWQSLLNASRSGVVPEVATAETVRAGDSPARESSASAAEVVGTRPKPETAVREARESASANETAQPSSDAAPVCRGGSSTGSDGCRAGGRANRLV